MHIQQLHLKNFKRFTDLRLEGIPENTKLVLLIGSNGSGKSSVFDAFEIITRKITGVDLNFTTRYFIKNRNYIKEIGEDFLIAIKLDSGEIVKKNIWENYISSDLALKFFGRSSIRIVPKITNTFDEQAIETNSDAPTYYTENDTRFINDVFAFIQNIVKELSEPVFSGRSADTLQIFRDYIAPLNSSLLKIFGGESRTTIQIAEFQNATPSEPAKLIFAKGNSKINYDLLSHGEKQVIILLLNFIVRKQYYEDAIIFIDEMDCHLNTALQFSLLKEITEKWIPDNSQLWTASHALGFIDYARKTQNAAIIDFDLLNFDVPQTIFPESKENLDVYEIAIPKDVLFGLLSGKKLVVCENKNDEYYNLLNIENTIFVGQKDSRAIFIEVKNDRRYQSLRDRDFLSDDEIKRIEKEYPNHHILRYYDFENYIYHPDNIAEINPAGFDLQVYVAEILRQKNEKKDYILPSLVSSRMNYEEFKTNETLKDKEINAIVDDLRSDDFEKFYKFFDMKDQFNKSYLAKFNLSKESLVKTKWFKSQIKKIIS